MESSFLPGIEALFRYYKSLGDKTLAQLEDIELHQQSNSESNSIATVVKHLHGNMLSRWTNFLTEDGEKPWRQREAEFEDSIQNKAELLGLWEEGWNCLFQALASLTDPDLDRIVYIRNEGHTVMEAIHRQLAHYAYHVGQIVFAGKQIKGSGWQSLTISRGGSDAYNEKMFAESKRRRHFTEGRLDDQG